MCGSLLSVSSSSRDARGLNSFFPRICCHPVANPAMAPGASRGTGTAPATPCSWEGAGQSPGQCPGQCPTLQSRQELQSGQLFSSSLLTSPGPPRDDVSCHATVLPLPPLTPRVDEGVSLPRAGTPVAGGILKAALPSPCSPAGHRNARQGHQPTVHVYLFALL